MTLTNVVVVDSKGVAVSAPKTKLAPSESMTATASGTAVAGLYENTGTATGTPPSGSNVSNSDTSSYFGADPQIAIQKDTLGANGIYGDNVMVWTNMQVTWRYIVTNPGNVSIAGVDVKDDKEGPISGPAPMGDFDDDGQLEGDVNSNSLLDPEEEWYYFKTSTGTAQLGSYSNKGSVSGSFTDAAEHSRTVTDTDPSSYTAVPPALVTDSALTTFDVDPSIAGKQFRAIFTPDPAGPGYKLNATNPGQFYANFFYIRTADPQVINWSITIPYPFVVQGANPMHAYNGATITGTYPGTQTIVPGTPGIALSGAFPTSTSDYAGAPTKTITGTFTVPASWSSSLVYLNLHLDYGFKGTGGYAKGGPSGNDAVDITNTGTVKIADLTPYTFGNGLSSDTVYNENAFKKNPGVGGRAFDKNSLNAKAGLPVVVKDASKKVIANTVTDEDGWFMASYKYTGKPTTFYVTCGGVTKSIAMKSNGFVVVEFGL